MRIDDKPIDSAPNSNFNHSYSNSAAKQNFAHHYCIKPMENSKLSGQKIEKHIETICEEFPNPLENMEKQRENKHSTKIMEEKYKPKIMLNIASKELNLIPNEEKNSVEAHPDPLNQEVNEDKEVAKEESPSSEELDRAEFDIAGMGDFLDGLSPEELEERLAKLMSDDTELDEADINVDFEKQEVAEKKQEIGAEKQESISSRP